VSEHARWGRGWRIGPKRFDWLRTLRCLLIGHQWQVNPRSTQRSCPRCWIAQDAHPVPADHGTDRADEEGDHRG
jgi:hypothetical protein